jgi:hypothetical protein
VRHNDAGAASASGISGNLGREVRQNLTGARRLRLRAVGSWGALPRGWDVATKTRGTKHLQPNIRGDRNAVFKFLLGYRAVAVFIHRFIQRVGLGLRASARHNLPIQRSLRNRAIAIRSYRVGNMCLVDLGKGEHFNGYAATLQGAERRGVFYIHLRKRFRDELGLRLGTEYDVRRGVGTGIGLRSSRWARCALRVFLLGDSGCIGACNCGGRYINRDLSQN